MTLSHDAESLLREVEREAAEKTRKRRDREPKQERSVRDGIVWGAELAKPVPPIPWICKAMRIAPGRPAVIVGEGGTAKSMLAQHFALSVSTGRPFLRRFEVVEGPTLWVDYEQGQSLTQTRLQRFARAEGWRLEDFDRRIGYTYKPFFIDSAQKVSTLTELTAGFRLVVVDSARRCAPSLKENDAEASIPFDVMAEVSFRTGVTFLIVDHASTKRGEDDRRKSAQRGHSTKLDGSGTIFTLTKSGKKAPTLVTCEREQLTGEEPEPWCFEVQDVPDPDAREGFPLTEAQRKWGLKIVEKGAEAATPAKAKPAEETPQQREDKLEQVALRLLDIVKRTPGISSKELEAAAPKMRTQDFVAARARLERTGRIANRTGKATRTEWIAT
jgi:hypothetical protein